MKNFFKNNKILCSLILIPVLLVIIFSVLKINNYLLILISLIANIFLISIIKNITNKLNIKISKKEKIFLLVITLLIYIFYIYSIQTRKFIYYWDYACYYNIQKQTIEVFNQSLFEGIRYFVGSTWSGEYGNFLSFFPQIVFNFTNKSINSYLISCILVFIPYVLYSFTILLKTIEKYFKVTKNLFYISISVLTLFPLLHGVLILGQPDFFGLMFIFLIISLTLKYDFKKLEVDRLILIFLLTFMLTICRRWYIYWIITYYGVYIINLLITNFKDKKNLIKIIKNISIYGVIVIILYLITLFPFIKNTLLNNYSSSYSFYSNGGALTELKNQVFHLGILVFVLIILGIIYGIVKRKYRRYTISMIIQYFLIIILFTKVQSMGIHHSLQLLVTYIYGIYLLMIYITENKKTILLVSCSVLITINFVFSLKNTKSYYISDIGLGIKDDENYHEIEEVFKWLNKNLSSENSAYMITHNNSINPDKFRNFQTPTSNVYKYLPYGSAIIGVHKFPLELFTAKYIITTTPFEKTSIEEKYNTVFMELVQEEKFTLVKSFKMKNDITLEIYERSKKVSEEEKNKYLEILEEESKEYKGLYREIINSYVID